MLHMHITHSAEMVSRNINAVKKQVEKWIAGQKELNKSWLWISIKTVFFFQKNQQSFNFGRTASNCTKGTLPPWTPRLGKPPKPSTRSSKLKHEGCVELIIIETMLRMTAHSSLGCQSQQATKVLMFFFLYFRRKAKNKSISFHFNWLDISNLEFMCNGENLQNKIVAWLTMISL